METVTPRDLRILPMLAVVIPLPTELTTPPVTKMNLGMDPHIPRALPMLRERRGAINEHMSATRRSHAQQATLDVIFALRRQCANVPALSRLRGDGAGAR